MPGAAAVGDTHQPMHEALAPCAYRPLLLCCLPQAVTAATAEDFLRQFFVNCYMKPRSRAIGWIESGFRGEASDGTLKHDMRFPTLLVSLESAQSQSTTSCASCCADHQAT